MWLFLKVCFLLLLVCSYSKAEDLTTGNILDPADTWTTYDRASTEQCSYSGALEDGEVCTGSANQRGEIPGGGGIISQEYSLKDQGLSVAEMQQGFDFEYGTSIESHVSNTSVPSCQNTTGDCKDYFTIKLNVNKSDGSSINTYEHTVEMDYSGVKDYKYTQSIGANNYQDINFKMDIWSVDAGYTSGYYGGIISDPFLEIQYKTVDIVTEIILDVVEDIVQDSIQIEDVQMEIVLENIYTEDLVIEMDFTDVAPEEPMIEMTEIIEEAPEIIEIEAEIEEAIEMESSSEDATESIVEDAEETEQEVIQPKEIKQKIANKLMAKLVDKSSNEAQTTQLALMVVLSDISFTDLTTTQIQDVNYYEDLTFYNTQDVIQDNGVNIIGYMDYLAINEMVDSQWQN
tara:strand:- start:6724 stop:7926 length:1203 start_codon:yes stop_codon:yes gene_type:complete